MSVPQPLTPCQRRAVRRFAREHSLDRDAFLDWASRNGWGRFLGLRHLATSDSAEQRAWAADYIKSELAGPELFLTDAR